MRAQHFAADFHCIPFPAKSFPKKVLDTIPLFGSPFRFTRWNTRYASFPNKLME